MYVCMIDYNTVLYPAVCYIFVSTFMVNKVKSAACKMAASTIAVAGN